MRINLRTSLCRPTCAAIFTAHATDNKTREPFVSVCSCVRACMRACVRTCVCVRASG